MALARLKVWIAGDVLTAADQNGEFNNILNNPISLISPTTGAINFNLTAHTNLVPGAISASSATAGNALIASTAATPLSIWGSPSAPIASLSGLTSGQLIIGASSGAGTALAIGSTGQVLSVTSSNTNPVWGVIPISGGLTSGVLSTGAIFYVSSSGVLTPLTIGTSGQVLTISSALIPSWAAASAAASGAVFSSQQTLTERAISIVVTTSGTTLDMQRTHDLTWASADNALFNNTSSASSADIGGGFRWPQNVTSGSLFVVRGQSLGAVITIPALVVTSLNPDMTITLVPELSTSASTRRIGLTGGSDMTLDPTNGLYFRYASNSTIIAVSRNAGTSFTINTTGVATSSFAAVVLRIQVTSSTANVFVGGVSQGTFTSSQIPAVGVGLTIGIGQTGAVADTLRLQGLQLIQDRPIV